MESPLDDDDEDERLRTGHLCSYCQGPLLYEDESFLLITEMAKFNPQFQLELVVDSFGDYMFEPCFFCFGCWENIEEELRDLTRDVPPVEDDQAILECTVCQSGIRKEEVVGTVQLGEFGYADRAPNNKLSPKFNINGNKKLVCVSCLYKANNEIVNTLWDRPVTQHSECIEGISLRCWRHGCSADSECDRNQENNS